MSPLWTTRCSRPNCPTPDKPIHVAAPTQERADRTVCLTCQAQDRQDILDQAATHNDASPIPP